MSEAEANHYCKRCGKSTVHLFSGSLTKGSCLRCGYSLPAEEKADVKKVVSYNG